jgi:uncharacterized membrane-anchored protein
MHSPDQSDTCRDFPPAPSTADLAALLALFPSPACLVTASGAVLHANTSWQTLSGALMRFGMAVVTGRPIDVECRLHDRVGAPRWFNLSLQTFPQVSMANVCGCVRASTSMS